ncbi:adenosine kinase [Hyphobacterium sp.]|uniref:adenosine kinase n=1 Tax=Hyphobacterium sp. TaxID=2004662 RepID=UPI003B52DB52
MGRARYDVIGVGNAIVDVIAQCDDEFLKAQSIEKGAMTLIDEARAETLYDAMAPGKEVSGGSAANTLAGIAALGARGAYIGKVADDELGGIFRHDLNAAGVDYDTAPLKDGPLTARCLINVTPDAQRSMSTFLGASVFFSEEDIDAEKIAAARITYLEGYLFDREEAKSAFVRAAEIAQAADRLTSLTLSDSFCVDRHRAAFRQLVRNHIDILFANEAELLSLYETDSFDEALAAVTAETRIAAVTRSEKGAVLIEDGKSVAIAAEPVDRVVDTTGAGDLFAAGMLTGLATGHDLETSGRLGAIAAAEIISHIGARPNADLKALAAQRGIDLDSK